MNIDKRVENLEKLVNGLIKKIDNNKLYQDADVAGVRKGVSDVTPYTETKTAYIGDTEIVFDNAPDGNLSVFIKDFEGGYPDFNFERSNNRIIVEFLPLESITEVTISII